MNTLQLTGRRLIFPHVKSVVLEPFTPASPQAGEVVVETACTLLSTGTETIVYNRKFDADTHWDKWVRYPFLPGYAATGRVLATGRDVTQFKPGDRVAWRGGHASHAVLGVGDLYLVPDQVKLDEAVWFALAKIAGHGVRAARLVLGDTIAVIGAGPIGQMAIRWALINGATKVVSVDVAEPRLRLAASAGALVVRSTADEAGPAIEKALGGRPRVVIDSTGNALVLKAALGWVAMEGTVVLLGDTGSPGSQTLTGDVVTRGLTLVGAHDSRDSKEWNNAIAADRFLACVSRGRFPLAGLNTHHFPPEQCKAAYTLATEDRVNPMGLLFDWNFTARTVQ
jgi:2-desacetyl-2-hydroxyethyl bacteriochlorophyllide A dehydrogenase